MQTNGKQMVFDHQKDVFERGHVSAQKKQKCTKKEQIQGGGEERREEYMCVTEKERSRKSMGNEKQKQ